MVGVSGRAVWTWWWVMVPVAAWLQLSLLAAWRPAGVVPNLALIFLIYVGLSQPPAATVTAALAAGLLLDLASGVDFGLRMAFFAILALSMMILRRLGAEFENLGLVLALTLVATLLYNLTVLVNLVFGQHSIAWSLVVSRVATEGLINLALAISGSLIFSRLIRPIGPIIAVRRKG